MNFSEYQLQSSKTAIYPDLGKNIVYPTLGLVGEAGEVAGKIKKLLRDEANWAPGKPIPFARETALLDELGDVLWYLAQLATELSMDFEVVAANNLAKLKDRQEQGTLQGDGAARGGGDVH